MKSLLYLLLIAHTVCAQIPAQSNPHRLFRRDSLPNGFPPRVDSPDFMPNARPHNFLHRHPSDAANVLRATLDNMRVRVPDSSTYYSALRSSNKFFKPVEPPIRFGRSVP